MSDWGALMDVIDPPYVLKRFLFCWGVIQPDWIHGEYKSEKYFLRKQNAIAYLVQKQLEGYTVRW
jgi:hypothetical protein